MRERTKLTLKNSEGMNVFEVDSDNRFGVIDRLAHWLRFSNIELDEMSISIHRYIDHGRILNHSDS